MAMLKCKMCGGNLIVLEDAAVAECEYCGTKQTVPKADDEKKLNLFNRANRLRLDCEFDKAAGVYESIVAEFPAEAEAYWGLVLCRYGIEYVDDPATGNKIPTCHRLSFDSIMEDNDFKQACENADAAARKIYRQEAEEIENIRWEILEVSGREEPYDIFICYKENDENGERTIDSVIAQDVYNALSQKGYRVFFSRISLEDKLGAEYEPYIFAALNSARVMLVFGTSFEHFDAVWVKNEWSRFLAFIAAGQKKTLIPCYKNVDIYDLPKEFRRLQAQDMGKVGAMQDLLRGIEKIVLPGSQGQAAGDNECRFAGEELRERFSRLEEVNSQVTEAWKKEENQLIAKAEEMVGARGTIISEASRSVETKIDIMQGMRLNHGVISPYFLTDMEKEAAIVEDAYLLITDNKICKIADILPLLEQIVQSQSKLVIFAESIEGEALTTLIVNQLRGTFKVTCIKIGSSDRHSRELLGEIAVLSGIQVISEELGHDIRKANLAMLGRARKIIATKENTIIVGGACKTEDVRGRAGQPARSLAVIRISGDSETEVKAKLRHMEVTLKARRERLDGVTSLTKEEQEEIWKREQERLVGEAVERAGAAGFVVVEESKTYESSVEVYDGMKLNYGYLSPYLVSDSEKKESVFDDPYFFITDRTISAIEEILPMLEQIVAGGHKLVIFAKEISDEVLDCLIVNHQRGTFHTQCVNVSAFGSHYREILEDIASVTGGTLISSEFGSLAGVGLDNLGRAREAVISKTNTAIIDGYADKAKLTNRVCQIREQIVSTADEEYRKELYERQIRLSCGVAVVNVGLSASEAETKKRIHETKELLGLRLG